MDTLVKRLSSILTALEDVGSIVIPPEVLLELKSLIQDVTVSKCSNGVFLSNGEEVVVRLVADGTRITDHRDF